MAKVGRNAPCTCGSGKKFKRCCGGASATPLGRQSHWHTIDEKVVKRMFRWAAEHFPDEPPIDDGFPFEPGTNGEADFQLLVAWAMHVQPVDEGPPIAVQYLNAQRSRLATREREWLEANGRAFFSVYEVIQSTPSVSLVLRCRFTGNEVLVHEVMGSQTLELGHHVLARVVELEETAVLNGLHPRPLSAMDGQSLYELARKGLRDLLGTRPRAKLKAQEMQDPRLAYTLMTMWQAWFDARPAGRAPVLQNTDGDPLLFVTERFSFEPAERAGITDLLASIPDADRDEDGDTTVVRLTRLGNARSAGMDSTLVATIRVRANEIEIETNSEARAEAASRTVLDALGARLRPLGREVRTLDEIETDDSTSLGLPDGMSEEEAAAIVLDMKQSHYANWAEHPLPALDGKTPKQAVKTKVGRERVHALLTDMERAENGLPPLERFDMGVLRGELGL